MQVIPNKMGRRLQKPLLSALAVARSMALVAGALALPSAAMAFQIAPMGSAFESKLTNETEDSLADVAGRFGCAHQGPCP